ncbi:hypothetical protein HG536_0F01570 [Torulaspora globosa]|uniref:GPI-anchored wall transfer protein n=1 Tax=Torulaspora globosa TaxID=48254 RepID=A0A7G3ZJZ6_9SACH|nr:uncharacterized protein HG536_0F01570 [Torulaspora globosa]QLL33832.1 hypothetical protein HG536_0F01570 [Torulaspora globosa]
MSSLKQRKEDFVTGLNGGSIAEINLVTSIALTAYICWNLLSVCSNANIFADFALNWICLLLSITTYSSDIALLQILIIIPCLITVFLSRNNKRHPKNEPRGKDKRLDTLRLTRKPFISAYRGHMLVLTSLAILAVDFQIFPRRFAKVETWGTSLMDLGVGSFVFSNGLVSARVLLKQKSDPSVRPSVLKRVLSALKSGAALLILGLLRLYFVKNLEYQEHVTEYGVHWNFFMTLALLPPFLVLVDPIADRVPRCIIAMIISVVYEFILTKGEGVLEYLILAPRNGFLNANREGIFSFWGYCSIFLWGQTAGFYLLGDKPTRNNLYKPSVDVLCRPAGDMERRVWDKITTVSPLGGLFFWAFVGIAITQVTMAFDPYYVSRRFANLPYVSWVMAYNTGFLLCYCLIHKLFSGYKREQEVPETLDAVNSNGLFTFLLSNLLTGFTNMSTSTIDASSKKALAVMMVYAIAIAVISTFLYKKKIYIKL